MSLRPAKVTPCPSSWISQPVLLGVNWKSCVETDPRYFRPTEVDFLQGNASKARRILGWQPEVSFEELVRSMVEGDLELSRQEQTLLQAGHQVIPRGRVHG